MRYLVGPRFLGGPGHGGARLAQPWREEGYGAQRSLIVAGLASVFASGISDPSTGRGWYPRLTRWCSSWAAGISVAGRAALVHVAG
jgi:hypothetical protein